MEQAFPFWWLLLVPNYDLNLKERFALKAACAIADIALKCLWKDPSERPTMRAVVESLKDVQAMKYPCCFPLHEPSAVVGKLMVAPQPLVALVPDAVVKIITFTTTETQPVVSAWRLLVSLPLPQTCASTFSIASSGICCRPYFQGLM